MKTLIIYASKTGVTEDCSKNISKMLSGEVITVNINQNTSFNLNDYDNIVIGTSLYAGLINKKIKNWFIKNESILLTKKVSFFVCGLSTDEEALGYVEQALTPSLREHIKIRSHFGGEIRLAKLNFIYRFLIKQILKGKQEGFKIDQDKLKKFVNDISK